MLSLYLFGGEVLHGFSFALVVGILIGTYSSIAVAAPMLVAYQDWRAKRGKVAIAAGRKAGEGRNGIAAGSASLKVRICGNDVTGNKSLGTSIVVSKHK